MGPAGLERLTLPYSFITPLPPPPCLFFRQELYGNATLAVLVARDPRDICTGNNQGQWHEIGGGHKNDLAPCLAWWASTWSRILEGDGAMARFAIVRIEDLVLPDPTARGAASVDVLACVTRQVHGMKGYTLPTAVRALGTMHNHSASYGGSDLTKAARLRLEQKFADTVERSPQVGRIAEALGYGLTYGGGRKAEGVRMSPHVCQSRSQ